MLPLVVRPARTGDVPAVRRLVEPLSRARVLVAKEAVAYYEALPEMLVAEVDDDEWSGRADGPVEGLRVVGCGALHVMWHDLAEIRTLATDPQWRGRGIGRAMLESLVHRAREVGVSRLFCLTFETDFFTGNGFEAISESPVDQDVYAELLRSGDEGIAEMLDLERVKPNTLGNTRMLRVL